MNTFQISKFSETYILPIFTHFILKIFYKIKINGIENIEELESPYLIVSNHVSVIDPFLFRLFLRSKNLPIRFMAVKRFDLSILNILGRLGVVRMIYYVFGVLVVEKGVGIEKNTSEAINVIKNMGNIAIFPEGGIVNKDDIGQFRDGAASIINITGVMVLPVAIHKKKKRFLRGSFTISIGKPNKFDLGLENSYLTHLIREKVRHLYCINIKKYE